MKILFLSFMCEDIGVAMVTSIILLAWLANYKRASHSGAWSVLLKLHSQNGFEVQRWDSYRWLSRWAAKFSHSILFLNLKNIQEDLWKSQKVMKVTVAKNPQHDAILRYAFAVIEFFSSSLEFWLFGTENISIVVFISPLWLYIPVS